MNNDSLNEPLGEEMVNNYTVMKSVEKTEDDKLSEPVMCVFCASEHPMKPLVKHPCMGMLCQLCITKLSIFMMC